MYWTTDKYVSIFQPTWIPQDSYHMQVPQEN